MTTRFTIMNSPVGALLLVSDGRSITGLHTALDRRRAPPGWVRDDEAPLFARAAAQLRAFFAGRRTGFDLPLAPRGTAFQLLVWRELTSVPHGATISYAGLARRVGRPKAARAVGQAVARNPIAIIVPCHRVVGAGGSLTGYAGGLDLKRELLAHESRQGPLPQPGDALPGGGRLGTGRAGSSRPQRDARNFGLRLTGAG